MPHYHPVPQDPGPIQTYCEVHVLELVEHGDMVYVCDCERVVCVVCEEEADDEEDAA